MDSVNLLAAYGRVKPDSISKMFTHNFLLDKKKLALTDVASRLKGNKNIESARDRLFSDYRAAYYAFMAEREASGYGEFGHEGVDQLDGSHWKDNKKKFLAAKNSETGRCHRPPALDRKYFCWAKSAYKRLPWIPI
jgi:hypothetical protein